MWLQMVQRQRLAMDGAKSIAEDGARNATIGGGGDSAGMNDEEAAPVREGEVLAGKYRVERVLGVGGMGVVVAATHLQLDPLVALNVIPPEVLTNPPRA